MHRLRGSSLAWHDHLFNPVTVYEAAVRIDVGFIGPFA